MPIGADRAPMIVIAARGPLGFVPVGFMAAAIDHAAGLQCGIDGMQIGFKTEPGISGHGIHLQIGIMGLELQKQTSRGNIFMPIRRAYIVQQGDTETSERIRQAQRQAAVVIAGFAACMFGCIRVGGVVLGLLEDWLAYAPFGGVDPVVKAKPDGIIGIAHIRQVLEALVTAPAVRNLPSSQQKKGNRVERFPASPGFPAKKLCRTGRRPLKSTSRRARSKSDRPFQAST